MATAKYTALLNVKSQLEALSFPTTVDIENKPIEPTEMITEYAQADLPLIILRSPESVPEIGKGFTYEEEAVLTLNCFWLDWDEDASIIDSYYEEIIESLDFNLSSSVVLDFMNNGRYEILEDLEYPLDGFRINFYMRIKEGSITDI